VTVESVTSSVEIGGLLFAYDQRVLEPRPWTRAQSEWARDLLDEVPDGPVLELCSGAGHIGLLALLGNQRPLVMVDADEVACRFARMNAIAAGLVDRVEIRHGQLEEQVRPSETFPLVIADPPWVPSDEVGRFPQDPVLAIDGGVDGLGPTRGCLHVIDQHLDRAGCAVLQVGGPAHVTGIGEWLDSRPSVRLRVSETRAFGDRGVLVLLRRPSGDQPC
jgi:ribosomal protein L3 glutamine methyltransferase